MHLCFTNNLSESLAALFNRNTAIHEYARRPQHNPHHIPVNTALQEVLSFSKVPDCGQA